MLQFPFFCQTLKKKKKNPSSLVTQIPQRKSSPPHFDVARPLTLVLFVQKASDSSAGDWRRPQTTRQICSAASPCWLCGGKVPKVDVKHVKCYLPHLLGHWIFMGPDTGVSLQPAERQRTSSRLRRGWPPRHAAPPLSESSQRSSLSRHLYVLFSDEVVVSSPPPPELTIVSGSNLRGMRGALCGSKAFGDESLRAPREEEKGGGVGGGGGRHTLGITSFFKQSCSFTPPPPPDTSGDALWPLQGSRSLLTCTPRFPHRNQGSKPNSSCGAGAFREAPPRRSSAPSRLPWL